MINFSQAHYLCYQRLRWEHDERFAVPSSVDVGFQQSKWYSTGFVERDSKYRSVCYLEFLSRLTPVRLLGCLSFRAVYVWYSWSPADRIYWSSHNGEQICDVVQQLVEKNFCRLDCCYCITDGLSKCRHVCRSSVGDFCIQIARNSRYTPAFLLVSVPRSLVGADDSDII